MLNDVKYNKLSNQDVGISILRIILCFSVIQVHFPVNNSTFVDKLIGLCGGLAVPCFMFISFYLFEDDLFHLNISKIKNRIIRLYIPVVFWNSIFIIAKDAYSIFTTKQFDFKINQIIMSMLFSHVSGLDEPLWFLISQIFILIILVILFLYMNNESSKIFILILISLFTFYLEYSGLSYYLFGSAVWEVKFTLGRTIECMPYAASGILFSYFHNNFKGKNKIYLLVILFSITYITKKYIPYVEGFYYNGLYLLFAANFICVAFIDFPIALPREWHIMINYIGARTMGVYCSHILVGNLINRLFGNQSFYGSPFLDSLIFIACLIISILLYQLTKLKKWHWISNVT